MHTLQTFDGLPHFPLLLCSNLTAWVISIQTLSKTTSTDIINVTALSPSSNHPSAGKHLVLVPTSSRPLRSGASTRL